MTNKTAVEPKTIERELNELRFHTIQNFSTKTDSNNGRTMYIGLFNATEVVKINNDANVRSYLNLDKDGNEKTKTGIHAKINETLYSRPEDFHLLNGGITVCASHVYSRDNDRKKIVLQNASIMNGAQTRGVLRKFLSEKDNPEVLVKVEIIVSQDKELFEDISVARNQQNKVRPISIAGKKGLLDELDKVTTDAELRLDESQKDRWDTEKLIQLIFASMPKEIWLSAFPSRTKYWDKSLVYSSKTTMFNKFTDISQNKESNEMVYRYFLDVANDVIKFYSHIQSNKPNLTGIMDQEEFIKKGYRINSKTKTVTILDGFIFPIFALSSLFVEIKDNKYHFPILSDGIFKSLSKLIMKYSGVLDHGNVQTLGKKSVTYASAYDFAELYKDKNTLEDYYKK